MHPNYDRRGKWEEKIYYKLYENSLEKYITQMAKYLNTHNDIAIKEFNKIVERAAEKTLMSKYKTRLLKNNQRKSEAPWINDEIINEIKKREKLFRKKRNCIDVTKRELHDKLYINQKKIVQTKIKEQMSIYEIQFGDIRKKIEITTGIRQGCTGSTILFKIVTYMIMAELDKRGK